MAYLNLNWRDTKKCTKLIGVSNPKILQLLHDHGIIYTSTQGDKLVSKKGIELKLARWVERGWLYNGSDRSVSAQQRYTVIQLSPAGITFVRECLAREAA